MHGPRKYRLGVGGGSRPIRNKFFFSHQLNLRFFLKKTIIFQAPERVQHFPGGGGGGVVKLYRGGGGGQSIRIQINCDFPGVRSDPLPPWILA